MADDRIANLMVCWGAGVMESRLAGRPRKRWIDSVNEFIKKISLDIEQGRRMVPNRNE